MTGIALSVELTEDQIQEIAARVAELMTAPTEDKWLNLEQAADYLGAKVTRIRELSAPSKVRGSDNPIPVHKDGSRSIFLRSELDAWVRRGGDKRRAR